MCQVLYQTLTIFLIIFATTLRCRLWCYVISQVKKLRKRTQVRHPKCTASSQYASSHTASCHTLGWAGFFLALKTEYSLTYYLPKEF